MCIRDRTRSGPCNDDTQSKIKSVVNNLSFTPRPILKGSCSSPFTSCSKISIRKDQLGNPIISGGKRHRIWIASSPTIHKVENWKVYNFNPERNAESCKCEIF
eukprot:TRINITY_DN25477_c0_g1_i1.p1 TRINITY_DN25477_c0_g1~~TRINITY_DN25477_c0_g1_i1.p1  ORF type:complete len:103 (+),score=6.89 TRINITY_DN25477_c0_g1_i1:64-372(+)